MQSFDFKVQAKRSKEKRLKRRPLPSGFPKANSCFLRVSFSLVHRESPVVFYCIWRISLWRISIVLPCTFLLHSSHLPTLFTYWKIYSTNFPTRSPPQTRALSKQLHSTDCSYQFTSKVCRKSPALKEIKRNQEINNIGRRTGIDLK